MAGDIKGANRCPCLTHRGPFICLKYTTPVNCLFQKKAYFQRYKSKLFFFFNSLYLSLFLSPLTKYISKQMSSRETSKKKSQLVKDKLRKESLLLGASWLTFLLFKLNYMDPPIHVTSRSSKKESNSIQKRFQNLQIFCSFQEMEMVDQNTKVSNAGFILFLFIHT